MRKLVMGVGVNDADYAVQPKINGKQVKCPYYTTWTNMLIRCYYKPYHKNQPTYEGCTVCNEWLVFSNFKAWMEAQDWEGKALDKDLLIPGNKVYNPDSCLFVSRAVNNFLTKRQLHRGSYPIGVRLNRANNKFAAQCAFWGGGQKHLGYYNTPEEAHCAWVKAKKELALELSLMQNDPRIAKALLETKYEEW